MGFDSVELVAISCGMKYWLDDLKNKGFASDVPLSIEVATKVIEKAEAMLKEVEKNG